MALSCLNRPNSLILIQKYLVLGIGPGLGPCPGPGPDPGPGLGPGLGPGRQSGQGAARGVDWQAGWILTIRIKIAKLVLASDVLATARIPIAEAFHPRMCWDGAC